MRELIDIMIENLEYFGLKEEVDFFREETERELAVNEFADNQALWMLIKGIAERLEQYTA